MEVQSVTPREVVVASGAFAPGHLGELTRLIPFEMVDEALRETGRVQHRIRALPSRVVVYLLLAGSLFADMGWQQVWQRLIAGLEGVRPAQPTAAALAHARRRLGADPLRWLFDLLRGPAAGVRVPGLRWRNLLICAIDGTIMTVADSPSNLATFVKQRGNHGGTNYPQMRLLVLVCCGARTIIDAVFGPTTQGETGYAPALLPSLRAGMMVILDRNFAARQLIGGIVGTGAHVLVRVKNGRHLPVVHRCGDGSYLSMLGGLRVRVVDCVIGVTTATGRHSAVYRLVTSLTDAHRYPAGELVTLYHQRWEVETAYLEIKSTILGGRVLRARTAAGVTQEIYALLIAYQILRTAMADATTARCGIDPDRASFTVALHAAQDQVIRAANVIAGSTVDLVGVIGRQVLAHLMPARRVRTRPRVVKRAMSKYQVRGTVDRTSYKATIGIEIFMPVGPCQMPPTPN